MKTKSIILIVAVAIITLSFTFASVQKANKPKNETKVDLSEAPAGGLGIDYK